MYSSVDVDDEVIVKNYNGVLHPLTKHKVIAVKKGMAKVRVIPSGGITSFVRETWYEVADLIPCRCENVGHDDGKTTCWSHHNCQWGDCTHAE